MPGHYGNGNNMMSNMRSSRSTNMNGRRTNNGVATRSSVRQTNQRVVRRTQINNRTLQRPGPVGRFGRTNVINNQRAIRALNGNTGMVGKIGVSFDGKNI